MRYMQFGLLQHSIRDGPPRATHITLRAAGCKIFAAAQVRSKAGNHNAAAWIVTFSKLEHRGVI
jgi:hypothetical protein